MSDAVRITRNVARCKKCGDTVESKSVHDFQWCKCKAIFVDGGLEYLRRGGDLDAIEEPSVTPTPAVELAAPRPKEEGRA